jgi:formylmethanofuran dehydrogenase subunit E
VERCAICNETLAESMYRVDAEVCEMCFYNLDDNLNFELQINLEAL